MNTTSLRPLAAALALLLSACQATAAKPVPPPVIPTGPQVLAPGQSVLVGPGASLRFERIANDSRCQPDVQCIWAGEVALALSLSDAHGISAFGISSTTAPKATVKGYEVELVAFGACPEGRKGECATLSTHPISP
jgi:hypothetical protein